MKTDAFALLMKNVTLKTLDSLILRAPKGAKRKFFKVKPCVRKNSCSRFGMIRLRACANCSEAPDEYAEYMKGFEFTPFQIATTKCKIRLEENYLKELRRKVAQLPLECFEVSFL